MKLFRLFASCSLLLSAMAAKAQIHGYVVDFNTGDTIRTMSASYRGHKITAASDSTGLFTIPRHDGWALTLSAVGYKPKNIKIKRDTQDTIVIKMLSDVRQFEAVTVKAKRRGGYSRKENPAVELMRRVIEAKKATDLTNHDFYQYNKYQKITLSVNDIRPEDIDSGFFSKHRWLIDRIENSPYNDKLILPLSVDETLTNHLYRKNPRTERDIIRGQQTTGINQLIETGDILNVAMKDVFTDVDIYDDHVRLLQYPFPSPIGRTAISFYHFYLGDTVQIGRDSCYTVDFIPANIQDFGFRGQLYILKDSTLHVKRCLLTIPARSDVNFVENLRIEQEYEQLSNGEWVLSQDDMIVELKVAKFISRFLVTRTTRLSDYAFDELPDKLFKGKTKERKEADAMMRDETFWNQYRKVELTETESSMDVFIKRIQNLRGFKYIIFVAKAFIENFVETSSPTQPSLVDIGPINTMITHNFIDGWRNRISAQTTANLSKHWFLTGYYAHGWGTGNNYYRGEVIYSFNKKEYLPREFPRRTISLLSTYDITSPSDKFVHTDKDNVFTALKWAKVDKMMYYNRQQATFEWETEWGLKTEAWLKTEKNEVAGEWYFDPFRTTEAHLGFTLEPGRTYVNTKQRRLAINLDAPVFKLSHTMGFKGFLGGDYRYNLTEAAIYKRFWMGSWGKIDANLKAGIQWDAVPFNLLVMPAANLSYIIEDETFNLINNMEFPTDRYASLDVSWDLNGKILNRIPLIQRLKWREYIGIKTLWGKLSDKNNPLLHDDAAMLFPDGSFVLDSKHPYSELILGVHNIFKIIHVEYVRRLNYTSLPTAHKHGIRFTFRMTF